MIPFFVCVCILSVRIVPFFLFMHVSDDVTKISKDHNEQENESTQNYYILQS